MSLKIIKQGLFDTFQDEGRHAYQHLGINQGGVMDFVAMRVVNALVGNKPDEAVLEMHYPAAEILFEKDALIALGGANFTAIIDNSKLAINYPVIVKEGCLLRFEQPVHGARVYFALQQGFKLENWLGSYSTNLLVKAGGYSGNKLKAGDIVEFNHIHSHDALLGNADFIQLSYSANVAELYRNQTIRFVPGRQYDLLSSESKLQLLKEEYRITNESNRMGYRLQSKVLSLVDTENLISSAVTMGTMQLLPNGQLIILMADHQTTGGYPVVGYVISADLPTLAQCPPGKFINFQLTDLQTSERLLYEQHLHLLQLQNACNFRLKEFIT